MKALVLGSSSRLWRGAEIICVVLVVDVLVNLAAALYAPQRLVCNTGGPWGMGMSGVTAVVLAVGALVLIAVLVLLGIIETLSGALLLGGGVANLCDRLWLGCVRDFALVSWFPAFNVADVALTVGALLILQDWWRGKRMTALT